MRGRRLQRAGHGAPGGGAGGAAAACTCKAQRRDVSVSLLPPAPPFRLQLWGKLMTVQVPWMANVAQVGRGRCPAGSTVLLWMLAYACVGPCLRASRRAWGTLARLLATVGPPSFQVDCVDGVLKLAHCTVARSLLSEHEVRVGRAGAGGGGGASWLGLSSPRHPD